MDQFLCSGFAIAPGNSNKGDIELPPVMSRQRLHRLQHVLCPDDPVVSKAWIFIYHHIRSSEVKRLPGKKIPVKAWTFERKKDIAGFQFPGVCFHGRVLQETIIHFFNLHTCKCNQ